MMKNRIITHEILESLYCNKVRSGQQSIKATQLKQYDLNPNWVNAYIIIIVYVPIRSILLFLH